MTAAKLARFAPRRLSRRQALRRGGAGLAAGALTGLGVVRSATAQEATPPAVDPGPSVTPERVTAALAQLPTLTQQTMDQTGVPGIAIAVVYQDEAVYLGGFGVRELGTDQPVDPDTVFQLASVSKPVASTVVAAVIGEGVASWDSRLADLTPGFALADPWPSREVTLRDMFAHRSGLPEHAGDLLEDIGFDRATVLHRLRYQKPASSFRSTYAYTNFGLTAAAVAAATATGMPWEDLSAERLYRPLGMDHTSSRFADYLAAPNRAVGHVQRDGAWRPTPLVRDPDAQSPAGGVSSTVRDLTRWVRLQLGNGTFEGTQVVAAAPLEETHRPQIVSNRPANPATDRAGFYGLGWNVSYDDHGRVGLGHSGGFALGAGTAVYLLPADGLGIVVLTNAAPIGVAETIALGFLDLAQTGTIQRDYLPLIGPIIAAAAGPAYGTAVDYATPPADPTPALAADAYVGTYDNDYFGDIAVVAGDAGLVLHLGPRPEAFPLGHYDRDVFFYQPVGENAGGPSSVTFTVGTGGTATSVVIEILDIRGEGTFTRT